MPYCRILVHPSLRARVIPGTSCLQVFLCTCVCASFYAFVVQSSQSCQRTSFLSRPQCLHRVEQPYLKNARPSSCRTTTGISRGCMVITGQPLMPLIHTVDQWRPRLRKSLSLPLPLSVPEIEQKPVPAPARQRRPRPPTKRPRSCRSPPTHPFPPRRSGGQGDFGQYDSLAVRYQMTRCGSQALQRRKTGVSQSEKLSQKWVQYSDGSRTGHMSQVGKG